MDEHSIHQIQELSMFRSEGQNLRHSPPLARQPNKLSQASR